ncbi:unnamed protein product [Clavelina lepadiformis]|uniref:Uncharacterized protein n=1 Tax=Clavelina lepadiformis TaxID=159417 RepID=A0ABP0F652_CLALP
MTDISPSELSSEVTFPSSPESTLLDLSAIVVAQVSSYLGARGRLTRSVEHVSRAGTGSSLSSIADNNSPDSSSAPVAPELRSQMCITMMRSCALRADWSN